jgi:hypothetical protein
MKIRTIIAVACLAVFGFVQVADARNHHVRRHAAKKSTSGGVSTSTTDVNGDGVPDVVVTPKPRSRATATSKPKSAPASGGVSVSQ